MRRHRGALGSTLFDLYNLILYLLLIRKFLERASKNDIYLYFCMDQWSILVPWKVEDIRIEIDGLEGTQRFFSHHYNMTKE